VHIRVHFYFPDRIVLVIQAGDVVQLGMVAHIYNPNYSGSREQEDLCSRPVQAKSSQDAISTHRLGMVVHLSFQLCGKLRGAQYRLPQV
jgi:hypothetical protein